MSDLHVTIDHELMVADVQGHTVGGIDFVDSYVPQDERAIAGLTVVDSGRILVHVDHLARLERDADNLDLSIAKEAIR